MGGKWSKSDKGAKTKNSTTPPNEHRNDDDEFINRLRTDLMDKPEQFLLNQILMSVQFYENFDRYIVFSRIISVRTSNCKYCVTHVLII